MKPDGEADHATRPHAGRYGLHCPDLVGFSGSAGISFDRHLIGSGLNAWYAVTADTDNDGDMDVLRAAIASDEIAWWENDGRQDFSEHVVSEIFDGATDVRPADLDSDAQ